jgi:hypothetical protein
MLGLYVSDGNDYKTYNTKSNDITPIIIGYGMSSEYDIGQLCNFPDLNSGQEKQYCVVGILPMNSSMPSLVDIGESVSLDYSYFQPIVEGSLDSLGSIDMAISSTVVFTEDESILRAIEEKSAQLDLFDMNYIHITDSIEEYIKLFKQTVEMKMFMCIVISLFSLISMIVSIMTMLSKKEYEFAIHYILGGTHLDIASRIVFRVMLLTFIASIPSIICFWGSKALIVLFMLLLIIIISITILPLFRIRNMNIIQILANTRR